MFAAAGTYGPGPAISVPGDPCASWLSAWCNGVFSVTVAVAFLAGGWIASIIIGSHFSLGGPVRLVL